MREIKYRAWDKKNKKIREVTNINFFDEFLYVDETPAGDGERLKIADVELMQYTGLKDRNGVEIYEGDIIGWKRKQGASSFLRGNISKISYIKDGQYCGFGFDKNRPLTAKKAKELEVIGNIYENPELLTEWKK